MPLMYTCLLENAVPDSTVVDFRCGFGLTVEERTYLGAVTRLLPLGWSVSFETTDSDETYARVAPPWDSSLSAFLIDRETHGLIVTDNLSEGVRPVIHVMYDVHDAFDHVVAVVSGRVHQGAH